MTLRDQLLDGAVAAVFASDTVVQAYRRYGLTQSIAAQVRQRFQTLVFEQEMEELYGPGGRR